MRFPIYRPRRLRRTRILREMLAETVLTPRDFILPLFVIHGRGVENPIPSMPGHAQLSAELAASRAVDAFKLGIPGVILFGIPEHKDEVGSSALDPDGPVQRAIKEIKDRVPEMVVITDVCLCEYTSHGHCGIIKKGDVDNDATLEVLREMALSHVRAGCDMVSPSDMMDGRVGAIRGVLDENGYSHIPIMSYSAKYASAFYGPFREAAQSTPGFGDRKSYQMDPPNTDEALREVMLDIEEGADIVMVKPALAYLDIIRRIRDELGYPVAAYNVSGEYSMIKAAGQKGWIDEEKVMMEVLVSIKRAGAGLILTYFAVDAARILNG